MGIRPYKGEYSQFKNAELFTTLMAPWVPHTLIAIGALDRVETQHIAEAWPDCRILNFDADRREVNGAGPSVTHVVVGNQDKGYVRFNERHGSKRSSIHGEGRCQTSVKATTLLKIFDDRKVPWDNRRGVALWIDCEGSELEVLKGGESMLPYIKWMNIEVTWKPEPSSWPSFDVVHKWVSNRGYFLINSFGSYGITANAMYRKRGR